MTLAASQGEIAEFSLRQQFDILRRSTDPTDQMLIRRFLAGYKLAMKAAKLYEEVACDSLDRERVEKLAAHYGERVAEDIAKINERVSWLAEATPRQRERRRNFSVERERVRGMSAEERWRDLHRTAYRMARRHGADPIQAQSFALRSLQRPRRGASSPVRVGHSRARSRGHVRRRGSRRPAASGSRAGPGGDCGDSDEPAGGRQQPQHASLTHSYRRRWP